MPSSIQWQGVDDVQARMDQYAQQCYDAAMRIAKYFEPILENYAKENASWTDRTGNARQSLHALSVQIGQDVVQLYIVHGMDYGKWLEIKYAGRYAILWPTIMANAPAINEMIHQVFGN